MFGGRRDQEGEAASAHAICMHGIHCNAALNTDNLRVSWREETVTHNHCHYTVLASVHESHSHTWKQITSFHTPNIILVKDKYSCFSNTVIDYKNHSLRMRKTWTHLETSTSFSGNDIHVELCVAILYVESESHNVFCVPKFSALPKNTRPWTCYSSTLKIKAVCSSPTSPSNHHSTRRHIQGYLNLYSYSGESLSSGMMYVLCFHPKTLSKSWHCYTFKKYWCKRSLVFSENVKSLKNMQ
jgi:hypothetical protein